MFGYATTETPQLMPMAIWTAHRIAERLTEVRRSGALAVPASHGKAQVTLGYDGHTPKTSSRSCFDQHDPDISQKALRAPRSRRGHRPGARGHRARPADQGSTSTPLGRSSPAAPRRNAGLTGRKIIIDTYGGACRHGGGAFSGKDPRRWTDPPRTRCGWIAKNAVAAGLAIGLEVQVAYAIGAGPPSTCASRPSAPGTARRRPSSTRSARSSTCARGIIETSTCCVRSTARPPVRPLRPRAARLHVGAADRVDDLRSAAGLESAPPRRPVCEVPRRFAPPAGSTVRLRVPEQLAGDRSGVEARPAARRAASTGRSSSSRAGRRTSRSPRSTTWSTTRC